MSAAGDGSSLLVLPSSSTATPAGLPSATSHFPTLASLFVDEPVLQNKGSTARDHLANERTYLAWMRTSLALIGASLGLLKWDAVEAAVGYIVAVLGVVCLLSSTERYFGNMHRLERGEFVPNARGILIVVVAVVAAIIAAFVLHFTSLHKL